MLSFYTIEDGEAKPNNPVQRGLSYAGGISDRTFDNLKKNGIIGQRFDYYSDFRWGSQLIAQIRQTIKVKKMEKDGDVQALVAILDFASKDNKGLIAYGD